MAIAVDQGFTDRLKRIEAGKQWAPEGVIARSGKVERRKVDLKRRSRLVTIMLACALIGGIWLTFASYQPEMAGQLLSGKLPDLSAMQTDTADG